MKNLFNDVPHNLNDLSGLDAFFPFSWVALSHSLPAYLWTQHVLAISCILDEK